MVPTNRLRSKQLVEGKAGGAAVKFKGNAENAVEVPALKPAKRRQTAAARRPAEEKAMVMAEVPALKPAMKRQTESRGVPTTLAWVVVHSVVCNCQSAASRQPIGCQSAGSRLAVGYQSAAGRTSRLPVGCQSVGNRLPVGCQSAPDW